MFTPIPVKVGELKAIGVLDFSPYLYVWTNRGYMCKWLNSKRKPDRVHAVKTAMTHFNAAAGRFPQYGGTPMYGRCGPDDRLYTPDILTTHPAGLTAVVTDTQAVVTDAAGREVFVVPGLPANPEWAVAMFSGCGTFLVVAAPGFLNVFRYNAGPITVAAAAGGSTADRDALLAAILESPDDDTPRLVYADWLEEHNDPARAEFIRVQCRTAYGRGTPDDLAREQELLAANEHRWKAEYSAPRGVAWSKWCRGFPGINVKSVRTLQRVWKQVRKQFPAERVYLYDSNSAATTLPSRTDFLSDVRHLEICTGHAQVVRDFLARPELQKLRAFRPDGTATVNFRATVAARLPDLEFLDLSGMYRPTDAIVDLLPTADHWPSLRRVVFSERPNALPEFSPEVRPALAARFPG